VLLLLLGALGRPVSAQEAPDVSAGPMGSSSSNQKPAPIERQEPQAAPSPREALPPEASFDKAIFQPLIPKEQLAFLNSFAGAPANALYREKQFHKLLHNNVPGWMYHYGRDMPLPEALDTVMGGSSVPVEIREGRYVTIAGDMGPYLRGRGFVWIDMQDGIMLGGFYFHPTNGEPTPTLTIFSRQIREDAIALSELPPAFAADMRRWSSEAGVPSLTTRYFIGDLNARILLAHDEDFCMYLEGTNGPPDENCEQTNADAADTDMNTAYYLAQVHYATNATARMLVGDEETEWIAVRNSQCGAVIDPLGCRIRLTREHTRGIAMPRPKR
jgi:hypothetical protein